MLNNVVHGVADLQARIGITYGPSQWIELDQTKIDAFAHVGGDTQWIHTDPVRAASVGGTVAHGFLVLSTGPAAMRELLDLSHLQRGLMYGLNAVRFPASAPSGSRVRMTCTIDAVEERPSGILTTTSWRFDCDRTERPVCVAEVLSLFTFAPTAAP